MVITDKLEKKAKKTTKATSLHHSWCWYLDFCGIIILRETFAILKTCCVDVNRNFVDKECDALNW